MGTGCLIIARLRSHQPAAQRRRLGKRRGRSTHLDTLDVQHAVEALGAAAHGCGVCRPDLLALADHDVVLILLLALPMCIKVGGDQLPHGRAAVPPRGAACRRCGHCRAVGRRAPALPLCLALQDEESV